MRAVLAVIFVSAALAQQPQPTSATIAGRVTDTADAPLRSATVTLDSTRGTQTTDDQGRFTFTGVTVGTHRLLAERNGYLGRAYGGATPDALSGTPIVVKAGEKVENLTIALYKQGVIGGRVTDGNEPLQGIEVRVARWEFLNGQRQLRFMNSADTTDDLGGFRVLNLPPGRYYVYADPRSRDTMPRGLLTVPSAPATTAMFPTYYPSAVSVSGAPPVELAAGGEGRADIRLRRDAVHTIRGTVMSRITGRVSPGALVGMLADEDPPSAPDPNSIRTPTVTLGQAGPFMTSVKADEQGKFELHNVPPGPHTLAIFGGNRISIKTGTNSTMGTTGSASAGADDGSMGYAPITMPNADLENITLTVSAPGTIQGKIQIEGGIEAATAELKARITTPQNLPPDILSRMTALPTVRLNSFAKVGVGNSGNTRNDGTQPDGSFSLGAVSRGVYYVAMDSSIQSQGYYVRSMSFDGTDISRAPLEFNGGSGELVITMAKGAAEITGTAAAGGVTVSLWPQTPDRSSATGNIKTTTADQNGAFKFTNVPPGDYHAVGFAQLPETGLGQYAPYLAALNGEATSIRLQPNTPANASVKVISAEKAAEVAAKLP